MAALECSLGMCFAVGILDPHFCFSRFCVLQVLWGPDSEVFVFYRCCGVLTVKCLCFTGVVGS